MYKQMLLLNKKANGETIMKLRPPSVPLITVDPYFSIWSPADKLYETTTEHWTGSPNPIKGLIYIDELCYRFMGEGNEPIIEQKDLRVSAMHTDYYFSNELVSLKVSFYTPLFTDDLYRLSRPVSYVRVFCKSKDGKKHSLKVSFEISEEIAVNKSGEKAVSAEISEYETLTFGKMGCDEQDILSRSGDDLRIDWGYFYVAVNSQDEAIDIAEDEGKCKIKAIISLDNSLGHIVFAYDDIFSLNYFGEHIEAYWKKINNNICDVLFEAFEEAEHMYVLCTEKSEKIRNDAVRAGGTEYAEIIELSYRQVIAAHKLACDNEGNNIFVSKECFSNGCAATVDVTYPSSPFFILYNTELLKAMLRPIFKFAASDDWKFDFAPHDVGQYPLVLGQVYGKNHKEEGRYLEFQMPVEECGNMIIMMTNIALRDHNTDFFDLYSDILEKWVKYLVKFGMDPENQLCTDDFAGHLAHNTNLSLKAIMGIAGYSLLLRMKSLNAEADRYYNIAKDMADNWVKTAANSDGSFRLTFDKVDTFSMKYNMIWDKIWGTGLFAPSVYYSEFCSYFKHMNAYGLPLDNRKSYTKSDWLVWVASLAPTKDEFISFINPLWNTYNVSPSRVPMTDWYDTHTSEVVGFRHRSVQGGLFIRILDLFKFDL